MGRDHFFRSPRNVMFLTHCVLIIYSRLLTWRSWVRPISKMDDHQSLCGISPIVYWFVFYLSTLMYRMWVHSRMQCWMIASLDHCAISNQLSTSHPIHHFWYWYTDCECIQDVHWAVTSIDPLLYHLTSFVYLFFFHSSLQIVSASEECSGPLVLLMPLQYLIISILFITLDTKVCECIHEIKRTIVSFDHCEESKQLSSAHPIHYSWYKSLWVHPWSAAGHPFFGSMCCI